MAWSVADVQRDRELRRDHKGYDRAMVFSAFTAWVEIHGGPGVAAAHFMDTHGTSEPVRVLTR